jgi:hypothetical protein
MVWFLFPDVDIYGRPCHGGAGRDAAAGPAGDRLARVIAVLVVVGAVYLGYVGWVAFGRGGEDRTRPPTSESVGCVFAGLGVPLLLGCGITALVSPVWRPVALVCAAAGGIGVVASMVAYNVGHWQGADGRPTSPGQPAAEGWTPGLLLGTLATLLVVAGGVVWMLSPPLRLAAIVALAVGAAPLVALLAKAMSPGVERALAAGGRPGAVALASLVLAGACAPVLVLFGSGLAIGDSPAYAWRYGPEVAATIAGQCTTTFYRIGEPRMECEATWPVGGETRSGMVHYRLDVPIPAEPVRAHVRDAGSRLAFTARTPTGTEASDDAALVLGRLPGAPLVVALGVELVAWVVLLRRGRRASRAAVA